METFSPEDFVEIYRAESMAEAMRIRDVVLRAQGIEAVIHDRVDHMFPAPATRPGAVAIAVPAVQRDQAVAFVEEFLAGLRAGEEPGPA